MNIRSPITSAGSRQSEITRGGSFLTASLGKRAQIKMGRDTLFATTADTLEVLEVSVWMTSSEFSADTKAVFPLQRGLMLRSSTLKAANDIKRRMRYCTTRDVLCSWIPHADSSLPICNPNLFCLGFQKHFPGMFFLKKTRFVGKWMGFLRVWAENTNNSGLNV